MHPRYAKMLPFATSADEIIAGFRDYTPRPENGFSSQLFKHQAQGKQRADDEQ